MGSMRNDVNRCTFMYADDRRCLNLIHTPGSPLCYYHAFPRPKRKSAPPDQAAARAFHQWLAAHPLDSATHVNQAINQLLFLVLGQRVSIRRANSMTSMIRLAMKSVRDVHQEFIDDEYRRRHWPQGREFLKEVQPLLASAVPQDPPDAAPAGGSSLAPQPEAPAHPQPGSRPLAAVGAGD